jgi:phenylacetate-CoA ligase
MGVHDHWLEKLRASQHFNSEQMNELRMAQLHALLKDAFAYVPYYRQIARERECSYEDFKSISSLAKLPVLEPEYIRQFPQNLHSEEQPRWGTFVLKTSGSSGKPLSILCSNEARQHHTAFLSRLREWFGIDKRTRRVSFRWRLVASSRQKTPPFWRRDFIGNNYIFSVNHLSPENMDAYYRAINSIRPKEIIGQPSSLFALAKHMKANKLKWSEPPILTMSTAETLQQHIRKAIEEQFECTVVNQYSCTEMALFVSDCEEGTLHVHPEHGILEVVDGDGCPVPEGEMGEVLCTSFINHTMPLIRYRLGDVLAISNDKCGCGRAFPIVKSLVGRSVDMVVTPDGNRVAGIGGAFSSIPGLCETQVIQTKRDQLVIKLVTDKDFSAYSERELIHQVRNRVGDRIRISLDRVAVIPREPNGKFKAVISHLPKE